MKAAASGRPFCFGTFQVLPSANRVAPPLLLLTLAPEGGDIPKSGFSTGGGINREINLEDASFGPALCLLAILALNGPLAAESIENQCRAAVRAELKEPNCRMANPRDNSLQGGPLRHSNYGQPNDAVH
jgi:hypothetical protein